jgi:hypothetical protein
MVLSSSNVKRRKIMHLKLYVVLLRNRKPCFIAARSIDQAVVDFLTHESDADRSASDFSLHRIDGMLEGALRKGLDKLLKGIAGPAAFDTDLGWTVSPPSE